MSTKVTRINQIAKERPQEIFTSIYHLINYELLNECYDELDENKAVGIDKVTKDIYRISLNENLENLVNRLKTMTYRPSPARKVNIPKANGKLRGLAIANFEDKIVQLAIKKLVEAIFEPKFTNNMFGFRPNRSCHDALIYLSQCVERNYTNYILDADIKGYFDNINHELIIKGLETHIKDPNLLRLIKRFLKVGIIENGEYKASENGTPQGSILSPVLANIVMYYLIILEIERVKKTAKGYVEIVNYADDMILCFQYKTEAEKIYRHLKERLRKCGLEFAEDKTRLIEFGRFPYNQYKQGKGKKPDTFDFLGFTHYCSENRNRKFRMKRKTSKKKFKQKVQEFKIWIKQNRTIPIENLISTTKAKLQGHINYYGMTDNFHCIHKYRWIILGYLFKYLNRRSQRRSFTWREFEMFIKEVKMPKARIVINVYAS